MISRPLGNDVYLTFLVKVSGRQALINDARVKVLKSGNLIGVEMATVRRNRVSAIIPKEAIKTIGTYGAVFNYTLADMGEQEYVITFKITQSALGKKRINADTMA